MTEADHAVYDLLDGLTAPACATIALRTGPTAGMDISAADHVIGSLRDFPYGWLPTV